MPADSAFTVLLKLSVSLLQSQEGRTIAEEERRNYDAHLLSLKLVRHMFSIRDIAAGTSLTGDKGADMQFIDHSSVKVLTRAALENYLAISFVFADPTSSTFRHLCWEIGGLCDRQRLHPTTPMGFELRDREKVDLHELRESLKSHAEFLALTSGDQGRLLRGKWLMGRAWSELGVAAGFHEKYFDTIYGFLCSYTHSSWLSTIQIKDANTLEDQKMLCDFSIQIATVVLAHFAPLYIRLFPSAAATLAENPQAMVVAENWRQKAKDMDRLYSPIEDSDAPVSGPGAD